MKYQYVPKADNLTQSNYRRATCPVCGSKTATTHSDRYAAPVTYCGSRDCRWDEVHINL